MPFPYDDPPHGPDDGMLDVGDGHRIHWRVSGSADGVPVVLLHGGPGSGMAPGHRRIFDPTRFRIVQFDQRGCGASTPYAGTDLDALRANTTAELIGDIERLRVHLGIDAWVVWGGSWGTTLGLAYAQAHPGRVLGLLLGSVVTTTTADVDWVTRGMGRFFPERWREFRDHLPAEWRDGNLAEGYRRLLADPDPAVHVPAALAWSEWEDTHVSLAVPYEPWFTGRPVEMQVCVARLVTHYWANAGFLPDGFPLDRLDRLAGIPVFLSHGRRDVSAPVEVPDAIARALPHAELFVVDEEGHGGPRMSAWLSARADELADRLAAR